MATINGTSSNDTLSGTAGDDTLNGFEGNDLFLAGSTGGNDVINGGAGLDSIEFKTRATSAITVDFVAGTITGGSSGTISFTNIERILTGNFDDTLIGNAAGQTLTGQGGSDTLWGAGGVDTLWSGTGTDAFVFREMGTANADRISDFASGSDKIVLDATVMSALGASGNFAAGDMRFVANSTGTAQDASDRIIYETDTRQIWYDADGNGTAATRQLLATLQVGATLVATDIVVEGSAGPGPIVGTEADDTLIGTDGNDTIDARGGNDTIDGRAGDDSLVGGTGNDLITGGAGLDGLIGGAGNDTLQGWFNNLHPELLAWPDGTDQPDTMDGGLGNDHYYVDNPADVMSDAGGVDTVHVWERSWTLADAFENLELHGDRSDVTGVGNALGNFMRLLFNGGRLEGRDGDDTLVATDRGAELFGEGGNDSLVGDFMNDTLDGGAGDDTFRGGTSDDTLSGGAGADVFILDDRSHWDDGFANPSFDTILDFASGLDQLVLDARVMTELGTSGTLAPDDPRFYAAPGATDGHDADDRLVYDTGTGRLYYDPDGLGVADAEVIFVLNAGAGAAALAATDITVINGTAGTPREQIVGTSGDDTLVGTEGNDFIDGLGGNDSIDALAGNDIVVGGLGQDTLQGGVGDDALVGGDGAFADLLIGGEGADRLTGGGGADQFVVDEVIDESDNPNSGDAVTDFAPGSDDLLLDLGAMPALGSPGPFAPGDARFHSAPGARDGADGDDRIVYDTTTGEVYYDQDGSGGGAPRLIVTLEGGPSLTATDIVVMGMPPQPSEGDDELFGTTGNDTIDGLGGDDTIDALAGDDLLFGSAGDDLLFGRDGADQLHGGGENDRIEAGEDNDTLTGGSGFDQLYGMAGDDFLDERSDSTPAAFTEGGAVFDGGAGNDTIFGSAANDQIQLVNNYGADAIDGGAGRDVIVFFLTLTPSAAAVANLESGTVSGGGSGSATVSNVEDIYGTTLDDDLVGDAGANLLSGSPWGSASFDGSDRLDGRAGNDVLVGGTGADRYAFTVSPGLSNADEVVSFSTGSGDWIVLDGTVHANSGPSGRFASDDARFAANSTGSAQDASDRVIYNTSTGQLWYDADGAGGSAAQLIATLQGAPNLTANFIEVVNGTAPGNVINGTAANDTLTGTAGDDTINGLGGNDLFLAGSTGGNDVINGGAGLDSIEFKERATSAIIVDFVSGTITGGSSGTISFTNIERILTGNFNDTLTGNGASQTLTGQGGADTIWGAGGTDTLWGGTNTDAFVFREMGTANADLIRDFASGSDKIVLDATVMSALGASGNFAAGDMRFVANSTGTAQDASDRIIYEADTRQIWYDADGNGTSATRQLIATLQVGATLVATDVVVEGGSGGGSGTIVGTEGDDSLTGTSGNDTIDGRGGNDTLRGLEGADSLRGGDGNDILWSNDGPTTFANPDGAADTLDGGLGDDEYNVDGAEDVILADPGGIDLVIARGPSWTLGDGLDNLFLGTEAADGTGNALDNRIVSAWAGGTILGMGGNDTLQARGNDLVTVRGGDGDDTLLSSLAGGANLLVGDTGNDLLSGHIGPVTMTGGSGADTFLYDRDPTQFPEDDLITDFATGEDSIRLDGAAMPALGASGTFASNDARFAENATGTAQDSSDRVVYNTTSGELWYDADGTGEEAAARLFTLPGAPDLAATDIEVVNGIAGWPFIRGTEGDDTLIGTNRNDTIEGLGGDDSLRGNDGADLMVGGDGNDTLNSWWDNHGDGFVDTLDGGLGDDVYFVNDDGDMILADPGGVDTVHIDNGHWTLGDGLENLDVHDFFGSPGNGVGNELDNIMRFGTSFQGMGGNDLLITAAPESGTSAHGGDGNDTLVGGGFRSSLFGDAGDDVLDPGSNQFLPGDENQLTGGAGADRFVFDEALGASANRILDFTSGADEIVLDGNAHPNIGASGRFAAGDARFAANSTGTAQDLSDRVIYNTANGELWYDADGSGSGAAALFGALQGAPTLMATDIEVVNGTAPSGNVINGTAGNDTLTGTAGDDTINGLGGNDLFVAGSTGGNDVIDGGAGLDSIEFKERATSAVTVDFVAGTITGGSSGSISFTNIERILTGNFNDTLTGNGASQTLTGQGGSDTIWGAGGTDTLWSGSGTDAFVFREMGTANADRIRDFASGSDKVHLDDAAFAAIGAMGNFAAADARFKANSSGTATDTNDRVVFNTSTGQLYYDADGSGSGAAAQLIATVQAGASVAAADIVVV